MIEPLRWVPWQVAASVWMLSMGLAVWAVTRSWFLVVLPLLFLEYVFGNINAFLGVVAVLSFRYPVLWAVPLLTKVTPGVGLIWFVVRREWRNLAIALGATALIAGISFLAAPQHTGPTGSRFSGVTPGKERWASRSSPFRSRCDWSPGRHWWPGEPGRTGPGPWSWRCS
ncbi:MAG: DUF2029 domain-containing protein [Chloroflexi bacterium]|nr:DUF2029 domain-containing protein [Chloroflexota bacterium]